MSLPPGFLDELRNRLSLGQVVGRKVMWDTRKSNPGKGDLWAPCPFHQEKSASFHVDDRKGFYYCFGCHAKGDAISFVRETENVDFMGAVKILAGEAGMPMPERDPQAQQKADLRGQLVEVMEKVIKWHRLQLQTGAAAEARDYLARRGLSPEAQARWDIGFAPAHGGALAYLTAQGVDPKLVIAAGIAAESDRGGAPYDRFRGRIIFPIRDARGRAIGMGGRAMDPNAPAKYYNSPETPLFDKGRSLFNHGPAREAAGKGKPLVVAEGYMDVIALSEAGFTATVAPLGTAITEDQLRLLWRIAPEPIIALDGDTAGLRAAMRLIDIALPLLEAGQSLRFALMPPGLDPDDVIKTQGAGAMQKLLDAAIPMVRMLWERELKAAPTETPEQKAALNQRIRASISKIKDKELRHYYGEAMKEFRRITFQTNWAPEYRPKGKRLGGGATVEAKRSVLAADLDRRGLERIRERIVLAVCIKKTEMIAVFEQGLDTFEFLEGRHQELALALVSLGLSNNDVDVLLSLGAMGFADEVANILADPMVRINPSMKANCKAEVAKMTVAEQLAILSADRGHRREMRDAEEDMDGLVDEGLTWRLMQANRARFDASGVSLDESVEFERGSNGLALSKDERSNLENLIAAINFSPIKKRNP
ncbi:DNA primase [Yoonia vestfoldensis]|uniref:DNA primase n=1 Tax=Yoonia vestfoldensis TaxID=245188 RepID=UPI00035E306E|nr:DNA primase [Yoonia vestfoldensis]